MQREPWTDPLTRRERWTIRYDLAVMDLREFARNGLWQRIAWKLPERLALWAFIRVSANVTDTPPDQITYPLAYDRWVRRSSR